MSTNFYWYEKDKCDCCDREYAPKHIGKRSAGWRFALHVDDQCRDIEMWALRFDMPGSWIVDEYGKRIGAAQMLLIIAEASERNGKFLEHENEVARHINLPIDYMSGEFS